MWYIYKNKCGTHTSHICLLKSYTQRPKTVFFFFAENRPLKSFSILFALKHCGSRCFTASKLYMDNVKRHWCMCISWPITAHLNTSANEIRDLQRKGIFSYFRHAKTYGFWRVEFIVYESYGGPNAFMVYFSGFFTICKTAGQVLCTTSPQK